jgi:hypothetical protein
MRNIKKFSIIFIPIVLIILIYIFVINNDTNKTNVANRFDISYLTFIDNSKNPQEIYFSFTTNNIFSRIKYSEKESINIFKLINDNEEILNVHNVQSNVSFDSIFPINIPVEYLTNIEYPIQFDTLSLTYTKNSLNNDDIFVGKYFITNKHIMDNSTYLTTCPFVRFDNLDINEETELRYQLLTYQNPKNDVLPIRSDVLPESEQILTIKNIRCIFNPSATKESIDFLRGSDSKHTFSEVNKVKVYDIIANCVINTDKNFIYQPCFVVQIDSAMVNLVPDKPYMNIHK